MKRVAVIADFHCGHPTGLTPEAWQFRLGSSKERDDLANYQNEAWGRYLEIVEKVKPIDALFIVGDCIDGRETGRHLVSEDRADQCEMAKSCIKPWGVVDHTAPTKLSGRKPIEPDVVMVYGTGRHTGRSEKWERQIARDIHAEIASNQFVDVDGVMFKLRHKIGRSGIPYGKFTALAREAVWNELKAARGKAPKASVHLFAHCHYFAGCFEDQWLAVAVPALQGASEYGMEEASGDVNWGVVWFDIEDGQYDMDQQIVSMDSAKPEVIHL